MSESIKPKWKAFALNKHLIRSDEQPIGQADVEQMFEKLVEYYGQLEGHDDTGMSFHVDQLFADFGCELDHPWSETYSILAAGSIIAMAEDAQACEALP